MKNNEKVIKELNKYVIDLAHRVTGYPEDVLIEYVKLNGGKYNSLGDLTIQDVYGETITYEKLMEKLYYLNRKMKINKLISNKNNII